MPKVTQLLGGSPGICKLEASRCQAVTPGTHSPSLPTVGLSFPSEGFATGESEKPESHRGVEGPERVWWALSGEASTQLCESQIFAFFKRSQKSDFCVQSIPVLMLATNSPPPPPKLKSKTKTKAANLPLWTRRSLRRLWLRHLDFQQNLSGETAQIPIPRDSDLKNEMECEDGDAPGSSVSRPPLPEVLGRQGVPGSQATGSLAVLEGS